MEWIATILGMMLLLYGRRLFWFFVASAGFAFGWFVAQNVLRLENEMLVLGIALLAGLTGALISVFIHKLAIGIAGVAAGGYLGATLLATNQLNQYVWLGVIIGGIIGMFLLLTMVEWALIAISALMGATLVFEGFAGYPWAPSVFLAVLILGIVAQSLQLMKKKGKKQTASAAVRAAS